MAHVLKIEEKCKFPSGDPDFIGNKPASYTIDLFQQRKYNKLTYNEAIKEIFIVQFF